MAGTSCVADPSGQEGRIQNVSVGVFGHVDCGKTSLVAALSTVLSTAALDKNPQSQARGMTIDLGFSAFTFKPEVSSSVEGETLKGKSTQITLVDCPGHASLVRTVVCGAAIIDVALLLMDARIGPQAQSIECLALAELCAKELIVVLNKSDLLASAVASTVSSTSDSSTPLEGDTTIHQEQYITRIIRKVRRLLSGGRHANAKIIFLDTLSEGILRKVDTLHKTEVRADVPYRPIVYSVRQKLYQSGILPSLEVVDVGFSALTQYLHKITTQCLQRSATTSPFLFAMDHCFPLKGRGSVVTGTVLSGQLRCGDQVFLPELQLTRKVKSMQSFHRPVEFAQAGDRVAVCLSQLDAKKLERGILTIDSITEGIRIAARNSEIESGFRNYGCDLPIGAVLYSTQRLVCLVRPVRFFGLETIPIRSGSRLHVLVGQQSILAQVSFFGHAELASKLMETTEGRDYPSCMLDLETNYSHQTELQPADESGNSLQWVVIDLPHKIYVAPNSLLLASKLDLDCPDGSGNLPCRLAFAGPIRAVLSDSVELPVREERTKLLKVNKILETHDCLVRKALVWLVQRNEKITSSGSFNPLQEMIGWRVFTANGSSGRIIRCEGGKAIIHFSKGCRLNVNDRLILPIYQYIFSADKRFSSSINSDQIEDLLSLEDERIANAEMEEIRSKQLKRQAQKLRKEEIVVSSPTEKSDIVRKGIVDSCKASDAVCTAIVVGMFNPADDIRLYVDSSVRVRCQDGREIIGTIVGPFGKLGKCKVRLSELSDATIFLGASVEL